MFRLVRAAFRGVGHSVVARTDSDSSSAAHQADPLDIAIVGLSGRYPQAQNLEQFWANLVAGRDCITEIPSGRWDHGRYFDPDKTRSGSTFSKWGGFIDGVDEFDPLFFNVSPRDAEFMEPQERLFLQCVYEALEDAGYRRNDLAPRSGHGADCGSSVGVYVGVMYQEYQLYGAREQQLGNNIALYGNSANVANRASYFFNFSGPSIAIDTMCSSSLTAIHLACQDLRKGACEAAIAGGVNVTIHPNKYLALAQGRFVSSHGQCQSFGKGGDGYVPGEGIGAVLLKPLAAALAGRDHIYAVIKASAINHGGKANGYSGPSPVAQAAVITQAVRQAGISPRQISYIEAHGTGTALGDPIEIAGLNRAFRPYTADRQFCAIGSVKSNIGHCESAAGIAGLTKVLLQMKHRQLVPSLHSRELNPHIDFAGSPFAVQQELAKWNPSIVCSDGTTDECRRIAGISSFGAGGSNAHILVEEYVAAASVERSRRVGLLNADSGAARGQVMIVLSAKDEERLKERAMRLLAAIEGGSLRDDDLADISFTLQSGREEMEARVGCVVTSLEELRNKLTVFVDGNCPAKDVYHGNAKRNKNDVLAALADDDVALMLGTWVAKGKCGKIIELWVNGLEIDWRTLVPQENARRLSLPTYPFAKERYWVEMSPDSTVGSDRSILEASVATAIVHPLLHVNNSDFNEQRFSSTFSGREWFLSDHVVNGSCLLPAAAHLEMARAALLASLGHSVEPRQIVLENVEWIQPVIVESSRQLHIRVRKASHSQVVFESYSLPPDGPEIIHTRGSWMVSKAEKVQVIPPIDLNAVQASVRRTFDSTTCYAAFTAMGIEYGRAHRSLTKIQVGRDDEEKSFALARVSLPDCLIESSESYFLHPSVMDGAMQACLGLGLAEADEENTSPSMFLPMALATLASVAPTPRVAWVYVRPSATDVRSDVRTLDVDIGDDHGEICARLHGLSLRAIPGKKLTRIDDAAQPRDTVLYTPSWNALPLNALPDRGSRSIERWVVLDSAYQDRLPELESKYPAITWRILPQQTHEFSPLRVGAAIESVLDCVKTILKSDHKFQVVLQAVALAGQREAEVVAALTGLFKSATRESTWFAGQVIELPSLLPVPELMRVIDRAAPEAAAGVREVRYRAGACEVASFKELDAFSPPVDHASDEDLPRAPWREGGVYLITGGAGALGMIFAREITRQAKGARIILTGRSSLDEEQQQQIAGLNESTGRTEYCVLDVTDADAVKNLVTALVRKHGALHGIVHGAGVIRDSFIRNKSADELHAVLAPKVTGTFNLDRASQDIELDFFILFSSIAGSLGNVGQGDYGAANAFMDRYAGYRNVRMRAGHCHGRMLSINWPAWEEGGMKVDEQTRAWWRRYGLSMLPTAAGLEAFYRAWKSHESQVMVLVGDHEKLQAVADMVEDIQTPRLAPATDSSAISMEAGSGELRGKTIAYLKMVFATILKLSPERIDPEEGFASYGIESVLALKLVDELEQAFGKLSRTLMFEHQSIAALSDYFMRSHRGVLSAMFASSASASQVVLGTSSDKLSSGTSASTRIGFDRFFSPQTAIVHRNSEACAFETTDIAIVGISGRYPGANTLEEYWRNLLEGKDSIREIPVERWDYRELFDVEKGKSGRIYCKWGGFIDGVDEFDPLFFNISPREAQFMDPQERLFLQCVYETLEDAGYTRESLAIRCQDDGVAGNVGVFVGVMYEEYQLYGAQGQILGQPYTLAGSPASIANRVSYFCNFRGPSMALDTMCSSSLTAIHLACQSLMTGACEAAIAGGVNVSVHPNKYLTLSQAQFLSGTGRCHSFGQDGDGYVPGEGVGSVLLKPLHKAIECRDRIHGVIKGSSINHGGRANGYTVPNPQAQARVIARALRAASVDPLTISYIEAHGTGTALGDPIEVAALTQAFGESTDREYCAIGSVKSNIGHLESAAGIAGLTKVLLQMQHRTLVPSLHADTLNRYIDFAQTPFKVQREVKSWERPHRIGDHEGGRSEHPRVAGLSSFGAGGSNAHLIIEEYVMPDSCEHADQIPTRLPALVVLSAKNSERLDEQAERILAHIQSKPWSHAGLCDFAYTLQIGREAMDHRLAFLAGTMEEVQQKLRSFLDRERQPSRAQEYYYGEVQREKETLALLASDEELLEAICKWIERGKYAKILELWVRGLTFDWRSLYTADNEPKRIGLPTYPFARDRYWGARIVQNSGLDGRLSTPIGPDTTTAFLLPDWQPVSAPSSDVWPSLHSRLLVLGGTDEVKRAWQERYPQLQSMDVADMSVDAIASQVSALDAVEHIVWLFSPAAPRSVTDDALLAAQSTNVIALYRLTRALLQLGYHRELGLSIVTCQAQAIQRSEDSDPTHAAIHGFVGSLAREYPQWKIRLVDLPYSPTSSSASTMSSVLDALLRLPADPDGCAWAYREGEWYRQHLLACTPPVVSSVPYRQNGVYVIVGGAGGIGEVFSEYLIRSYCAHVVWIGRRKLTRGIQDKLDRLAELGPRPTYLSADASDREALERAYRQIKSEHVAVHGLVHAAIELADGALLQMDEAKFEASLTSKANVSVRMAQVFAAEPLDWVLFFSSMQSFARPAGQSNYAAGCAFKDAYSWQLSREWCCTVKTINWGYWGNIGVVASADYRSRMARQGIGSIEADEGMAAVTGLLASSFPQVAFLKVIQPAVLAKLGVTERIVAIESVGTSLIGSLPFPEEGGITPTPEMRQEADIISTLRPLVARLLFVQLHAAGLFADGCVSVHAWRERRDLPQFYDRWLEKSIRVLAGEDYLSLQGTACAGVKADIDPTDAWTQWEKQRARWEHVQGIAAQARLVETALRALPSIFAGHASAIDVIFPNASMHLVEGVYKNNSVADYFNSVLADTAAAFIEARLLSDANDTFRILELGAGTGSASESMFKRLAAYGPRISEYCYTDVSGAFLQHARRSFAPEVPYLVCRQLDIEQPLESQEIDVGKYDLVIASNVLHATRNVRDALHNAKAALKRHGLLLVTEITGPNLLTHVTFGLLEGWWRHEDEAVRLPGSPAISGHAWRRLLTSAGFEATIFPVSPADDYGLQVIMAESDGLIRKPYEAEGLLRAASSQAAPLPAKEDGDDYSTATAESAITEMLASVLSMEPASIRRDDPFSSFGLDSILSVQALKALKDRFSLDLSFPDLASANTVRKLGAHLVAEGQRSKKAPVAPLVEHNRAVTRVSTPSSITYDDRAIHCLRPAKDPAARLLLFPCLGFGEQSYAWVHKLPSEIEVWFIGTSELTTWESLITAYAAELQGLFDRPVVTWGHSMGCIAAFEVLVHLQEHRNLLARAAIFSSCVSPPAFERVKYAAPFSEISPKQTDQEVESRLVASHIIMPRSSWVPLISPQGLRNDVALIHAYHYDVDKQIASPAFVIHATNDVVIRDRTVVQQWSNVVAAECLFKEVDATHLLFMDPPQSILELIVDCCSGIGTTGEQRHWIPEAPHAGLASV